MKFDFDEIINRRNNNSDKWTFYSEDTLPMWIADMDFKAPPEVVEGLARVSENGVYGYGKVRPERLLDAITYRMKKLYDWDIDNESIVLLPSLVAGLNLAGSMVKRRNPEASYLLNSPIYPPFLGVADNQDIKCIDVPLKTTVQNGNQLYYEMDFEGIEAAIEDNTEIFMLCQPHNPSGRIFNKEELTKLNQIIESHNLLVLSDEIHGELVLGDDPKIKNIPFALISKKTRDRTITLFSASKTFNLAGLSGGFAIIENKEIRQEFENSMKGIVPRMNVFAMKGTELAFDYGDEWLYELKQYLTANRNYLVEALSEIEGLKFTNPEATFLIWLDFSETKHGNNAHQILLDNKLALNNGVSFGASGSFVRLNFACPRSVLEQGVKKIKESFTQ